LRRDRRTIPAAARSSTREEARRRGSMSERSERRVEAREAEGRPSESMSERSERRVEAREAEGRPSESMSERSEAVLSRNVPVHRACRGGLVSKRSHRGGALAPSGDVPAPRPAPPVARDMLSR
jgi:hypothetical protein